MSVWIREDGTITDGDDPTAFEYVSSDEIGRLRAELEQERERVRELYGKEWVLVTAMSEVKACVDNWGKHTKGVNGEQITYNEERVRYISDWCLEALANSEKE